MPYPIPTDERRDIVRELSAAARILDAEAEARATPAGSWNTVVRAELARAAGSIRLVATLIVQGGMSTPKARFWLASTRAYLALVKSTDAYGVIR